VQSISHVFVAAIAAVAPSKIPVFARRAGPVCFAKLKSARTGVLDMGTAPSRAVTAAWAITSPIALLASVVVLCTSQLRTARAFYRTISLIPRTRTIRCVY
jgi:hypothetical protein